MIHPHRIGLPVLAAALLLQPRPARALPEAAAAAGRALAAKYADAIISVEVVATLKITIGDRTMPAQEVKQEPNGTVISASGLTVTSLSQIDPRATIEAALRARGQRAEIGDTVYKEVKLRQADGTEVAARVVLKDPDLDLAFVAPTLEGAAATKPFAYVNLDDAAPAQVLADYFYVTRASKALQRVPLVNAVEFQGIDPKPRLIYIVGGAAPGCPVFNPQGKILGIGLFQINNGRPTPPPIVMPAADVADEAKQAAAAAAKPPPEPVPTDDADQGAAPASVPPTVSPASAPATAPAAPAAAPTKPPM